MGYFTDTKWIKSEGREEGLMGRNIFIFELYLVLIFLSCRLYYYIKRDRRLWKQRSEKNIKKKPGAKPEMRDPILKRG